MGLNHNLAVYSYDVQNSYARTLQDIQASIAQPPSGLVERFLDPLTPHDVDRAAERVLANACPSSTLVSVAKELGNQGGIETLVIALGANNVLDVVIGLKYKWATSEAEHVHGRVWSPSFFRSDWDGLVSELRGIDAQHVIVATVPHVTIVPLLAAVGAPRAACGPTLGTSITTRTSGCAIVFGPASTPA